jgi:SPP1 family predicted phage head-tail adaptor
MQAGKLDRKISIERRTDTRDAAGQPIPTWTRIGATRWAAVMPVSGGERFTADQFIGRQQTEFQIRWASDISDISPLDRIVYPVASSPSDNEIYDVLAVHEIGRRAGLRIITSRRSET